MWVREEMNIALLTVRTHLTKLLSTTTYSRELKSNVHLDKAAFSQCDAACSMWYNE